jgi:hypothetical protein
MAAGAGPELSTNGLVFSVDSRNNKSYPGSGNTWYDQARVSNVTLNGTFDTEKQAIKYVNNTGTFSPPLSTFRDECTIETWFYMPSGGIHTGCCETLFGTYWFRFFQIGTVHYTMIGFANPDGTYKTYQHPAFSIAYDSWHHTVGMRRADRYIIWIDGVEVYNGSFGTGDKLFGLDSTWYFSASSHTDLRIAAARVYNRGLTDVEILKNYSHFKNRYV